MPRYEVGVAGVTAAAAAAYATLHTGAAARARVVEVGFFQSTGVASSISLGRPANTPVATTSVLGQAHDLGTSTVNVDTAWSTAPTAPTQAFRRLILPANIGAGIIWTFYDDPIVLPVSSWLTLWNFGAGAGAANVVYFVYDE